MRGTKYIQLVRYFYELMFVELQYMRLKLEYNDADIMFDAMMQCNAIVYFGDSKPIETVPQTIENKCAVPYQAEASFNHINYIKAH